MAACLECGSPVTSIGRGRPRKFCLDCRPRRGELVDPGRETPCDQCGNLFHTRASRARFCSLRCRDLSRRGPCSTCGAPVFVSATSAKQPRCRNCWRAAREHGTTAMYRTGCRCADCRAAKAAEVSALYAKRRDEGRPIKKARGEPRRYRLSRADRLAIYERDGWTCQLCQGPVDSSLHFNDPMAASLDHIAPQSLALTPDHSPGNLRLAHRICNARRGNRSEVAAC